MLVFPASLFAQSDGSVEPPPAVTEEKPQEIPFEAPPATETAPVVEQAASPEPVVAQAPAPAPRPTGTPVAAPAPVVAEPAPSAPEPVSLEEVQEALETIVDEVPSSLQPWLYALAGALGAVIVILGVQAWLKKSAEKKSKCAHCKGTGHEKDPACAGCKGTGMVEEEKEVTMECLKCEGEGEASCGPCKGGGGTETMSCATCRGKGKKDCAACLGEGEASVTLKREVPCPDCK